MFVFVDEYKHFANDLIAMGKYMGEEVYKAMVTFFHHIRRERRICDN
ncbi:MAG: hypothetical protein LBS42_10385 [Tannerella sp.]|nr:hypothetical protein [Tannerella sp.]